MSINQSNVIIVNAKFHNTTVGLSIHLKFTFLIQFLVMKTKLLDCKSFTEPLGVTFYQIYF